MKNKNKFMKNKFFFFFSKFPLLTLVLFFILFLYFENKMKNGLQDANSKSFLENKNENRLKTAAGQPLSFFMAIFFFFSIQSFDNHI
jgi:hypothetical protein